MSLIFPFYGGWFFCKPTFVYGISIAKRPSLTIIPDVHMHKAVSSNFRFAFVGSFPPKKCGDENRSLVGFQGEEGCCFISQMDDKSYNFFDFGVTCSTFISLCLNIRNTWLYFYLVFDFLKLGENVFSQGPK